jgi:hypothetical protein
MFIGIMWKIFIFIQELAGEALDKGLDIKSGTDTGTLANAN